jgi:8-oxo-dGTP pyrophosphatase MutT (NUDIX family)
MTDESNPWTRLSTQRFYESQYVEVEEDQVRHRSGRIHSYTALRYRVHGIAVLPIDQAGFTYLVGQYRYLPDLYTWELPRGSGPLDADPLQVAQRELREETGLEAENWLELFSLLPSPGISSERAPCFVAWNTAQRGSRPDQTETLAVRRIRFSDAVSAAASGEIIDAPSVASILAVQTRALKGDLPDDLLGLLSG